MIPFRELQTEWTSGKRITQGPIYGRSAGVGI
jgi:hypothetical protein